MQEICKPSGAAFVLGTRQTIFCLGTRLLAQLQACPLVLRARYHCGYECSLSAVVEGVNMNLVWKEKCSMLSFLATGMSSNKLYHADIKPGLYSDLVAPSTRWDICSQSEVERAVSPLCHCTLHVIPPVTISKPCKKWQFSIFILQQSCQYQTMNGRLCFMTQRLYQVYVATTENPAYSSDTHTTHWSQSDFEKIIDMFLTTPSPKKQDLRLFSLSEDSTTPPRTWSFSRTREDA